MSLQNETKQHTYVSHEDAIVRIIELERELATMHRSHDAWKKQAQALCEELRLQNAKVVALGGRLDNLAVVFKADGETPPVITMVSPDALATFDSLAENWSDVWLVKVLLNAASPGWREKRKALAP